MSVSEECKDKLFKKNLLHDKCFVLSMSGKQKPKMHYCETTQL